MNISDYLRHDAVGLADLVARRQASPQELLEAALAQTARVNPKVNAVCRLMEAEAKARVGRPLAGPFAGVPLLLKDLGHDYAGLPTTWGSRSMRSNVPAAHASVVRRYLEAGFVVFGKTNLPEFGLKAVSDCELFGRASNPWGLDRTPGGSSGGAAAAVAAGILPMAAANDGGGSIRLPAAYCGLFGLKPSRGRVSLGPAAGELWFGAVVEGVISRSVRDTAAALDLLSGPEPGDPFAIPPPEAPFAELMPREPARLRIAFTTASPIGTEVHAEAKAAVADAATLLASLGHQVEEGAPEVDGGALARSYIHLYFGSVAAMVAAARARGATRGDFELLTRILATLGGAVSAGALTTELLKWNDYARGLARFHARYDLWLTPTLAHPPIRHGTGDPPPAQAKTFDLLDRAGLLGLAARLGALNGVIDQIARDALQYVPFTQLANLTGTPAMSVPLHWTADGLPLGVQFVGRFGEEARLLQLARELEQARPWFHRRPAWVTEGT